MVFLVSYGGQLLMRFDYCVVDCFGGGLWGIDGGVFDD